MTQEQTPREPILDRVPELPVIEQIFNGLQTLKLELGLSDETLSKLAFFGGLVLVANEKINLTAITKPQEFAEKHIVDSLALLPYLPRTAVSIVDIGSGAGFPGVVLAIACPQIKVTLLESVEKKCRFLAEAVTLLSLPNVKIVIGRAEEFGQKKGRANFDVATARAVAGLSVLLEYGLPLLKQKGRFFAYKGPKAEGELAVSQSALQKLGGKFVRALPYRLSSEAESHQLLEFIKEKETPANYPRKAGMPKKDPL